ncbi:tyrosine-protein phosphatase [Marinobacter sp. NP-6]|uniref:tyrosine-protein phosphatase n=1 Tax=Marinobacter sp. NP-6 TaxID=2488666 RepID=UPI000FCA06EE|nr:tyrosine-protein phosphatase [Marinobacter sp. NP-6]RUT76927.1 tyrosine-protein phosphatase [Marinobacter sp. NP-6]
MSPPNPTGDSNPFETSRRIELAGAINFRDLGGYTGADGRKTRWRILFRSDSLSELTDADLQKLSQLNLKSIFDLRDQSEADEKPNKLTSNWTGKLHHIGFYPYRATEIFKQVKRNEITPGEVRKALKSMYSRLPQDHASNYSALLHGLGKPGALPALLHCTSGKDRTGFAALIILLALGVSKEEILEDYLLTNSFRRDLTFLVGNDANLDVVNELKSADAEYLEASFEYIETVWGGSDMYLREALSFDDNSKKRLRQLLLE